MNLADNIQEWLANRFSSVQYPNIRPADHTTRNASRTGLRFRTAMPFGKRIDLFLLSLGLLVIGLIAAGVVGVLIYALLF